MHTAYSIKGLIMLRRYTKSRILQAENYPRSTTASPPVLDAADRLENDFN